jgi:hypothetical protein
MPQASNIRTEGTLVIFARRSKLYEIIIKILRNISIEYAFI